MEFFIPTYLSEKIYLNISFIRENLLKYIVYPNFFSNNFDTVNYNVQIYNEYLIEHFST